MSVELNPVNNDPRRGAPRRVAKAEAIADGLPRLLVDAERVAATVAQGLHGRRRVGMGETFWQYRAHAAHDSVTAIDWRRSARSDDLFVRETEWEASQSVWLWSDRSPSMNYSSDRNRPTKEARAFLLMLASAATLLRGGERVGLIGLDRRAVGGRAGTRRLAQKLLAEGDRDAVLPTPVDLPRHSTGLLFGDFFAPVDDWARRFNLFAEQRVKGLAVQILDPAEEELPFSGRARFLGMEDEGTYIAERVETLRSDYRNRLLAHREALRLAARAAGWDILVHHTDHSAEQAMTMIHAMLGQERR